MDLIVLWPFVCAPRIPQPDNRDRNPFSHDIDPFAYVHTYVHIYIHISWVRMLRTLCHLIDSILVQNLHSILLIFCLAFFFLLSAFQFSFCRFSPRSTLEMRFQNVIGQCARWIPLAISFARQLPLSLSLSLSRSSTSFNMFIRSSLWLAWLLCGQLNRPIMQQAVQSWLIW